MTTTIKAEGPGSPIEQAVADIIRALEAGADVGGIQAQLHAILPNGNWYAVTTAEGIIAEYERLKREQETDMAKPSLAKAINAKRRSQDESRKQNRKENHKSKSK